MSAVEMQPVLGAKKPNLVVIDEIDGIVESGKEVLVLLYQGRTALTIL
jgi:hypothetical protein